MAKVYNVVLTPLGKQVLEHSGGNAEVVLETTYDSVEITTAGALHFKWITGEDLVYAPGMWACYTSYSEERS